MAELESMDQILARWQIWLMGRHRDLKDFSLYSPNTAVLEVLAGEFYLFYKYIEKIRKALNINEAEGEELSKLILDRLPSGRLPGTKAYGEVRFYRQTAAPFDITIPAGTSLMAQKTTDDEETVEFVTTADAAILEDETECSVTAEAALPGELGNVSAYRIRHINAGIPGTEMVENPLPFVGGTDQESDKDLKERYINTVYAPGRATALMIEAHLNSLQVVSQSKVFSYTGGEVGIIVDANISEDTDEISQTIYENIAAGILSRGVLGARISPDADTVGIDDSSGGKIWAVPRQSVGSTRAYTITYLNTLGVSRSGTITLQPTDLRGVPIAVELEDAEDLAKEILAIDPTETGEEIDFFIGRGLAESGKMLLWNTPEYQAANFVVRIRRTMTPEANLDLNIGASLENFLNHRSIGEDLAWSDAYDFIKNNWEAEDQIGRRFDGINDILEFKIVCKAQEITGPGQVIDIEDDERIVCGSKNVFIEYY